MKTYLLSTSAIVALLWSISTANAAECGDVVLAVHNVQSAEVLTFVDKFILENGYGCTVQTVPGDTVPTTTSMVEKGDPDVSSETWIDLLPEIVPRGVADGKIVLGAPVLPDGGVQGLWIPKYLADAHPDIKTIDDALKHPELFPDPEDASKGVIFNGAAGWGATIVTAQLFKAYKGEEKASDYSIPAPPPVSTVPSRRPTSARKGSSLITGHRRRFSAATKWSCFSRLSRTTRRNGSAATPISNALIRR